MLTRRRHVPHHRRHHAEGPRWRAAQRPAQSVAQRHHRDAARWTRQAARSRCPWHRCGSDDPPDRRHLLGLGRERALHRACVLRRPDHHPSRPEGHRGGLCWRPLRVWSARCRPSLRSASSIAGSRRSRSRGTSVSCSSSCRARSPIPTRAAFRTLAQCAAIPDRTHLDADRRRICLCAGRSENIPARPVQRSGRSAHQ